MPSLCRHITASFAVSALLVATCVFAQPYPNKAIRLIAPSSTGSGVDLVSRILATPLGTELGQQVVVDNRAGAGGNIGADIASKAAPNGYTLMMGTPSQVINAHLYKNLSPNLLGEFAPISLATSGVFVLIVNNTFPAKTTAQFIQLAKAKPGGISYGSAGQGNVTHLAGELFKHAAGVDLLHVPYKGSGPALVALMGGQIQTMFANIAAANPHIRAGRVHAIATTGSKRAGVAPDVPTFAEGGVGGYEVTAWFGLLAPKGTPRDVLAKLQSVTLKVLKSPETSERLSREGLDPVGSTPAEFARHLEAESKKWARAVQISGTKAE
jgi:tripartite-type tricarboxylate transporter receptor subunit TctC